jgi:Amt family ammonium transporter
MWLLIDLLRNGKQTAVGAATGAVVGLVAITRAAGFVSPRSAIVIGAIAALPSYFAIQWRPRTRLDDSLDVFAAHGVGGITGALLTGVFAQQVWRAPANGALFGGVHTLFAEVVAIAIVFAYSFACTFALLKLIGMVAPLRRTPREEAVGMDVVQHGEDAYNRGEGALLVVDRRGADRTRGGTGS